MAYHVYTTTGIVLSSAPLKEVDRYYRIFTKDLGTVYAVGKGVRKNESKMRGSLDDFSITEVSFIKGRREWRIVNAKFEENIFRMFRGETNKRVAVTRLLFVVQTLVAGEEPNSHLFNTVLSAIDFLKTQKFSSQEIRAWESVATLRMLSILGYASSKEMYDSFLSTDVWSDYIIHDAVLLLDDMESDIKEALLATDLQGQNSVR